MIYLGEMSALGAAFCWSWTLTFFTAAGKRIGAFSVNVIRLTMAVPMLFITSLLVVGTDVLHWYDGGSIWLLLLSGVVGLTLGDYALFSALVYIGPRKTTVIFSTVPIITALVAWVVLGEVLNIYAWSGIILTVSGMIWVVAERNFIETDQDKRNNKTGIIYALLGTAGQAVGLVLTKAGMAGVVNPLPATFMRMIGGLVGMYFIVLVVRKVPMVIKALSNKKAISFVLGGAIFGPFIGVWLSIVAVKYSETGVAATLMGLVPIMILPIAKYIFKESISPRAYLGTFVAVAGVALLFLR